MRIGLLAPQRRYEDSFLGRSEPLFTASGENLGNFAFAEALWRHLQPEVTILPWGVSRAVARERCDLLVFAGANQLGAHTDLGGFASHLESIGLPLVAIGLGAQSSNLETKAVLTPGTERWLRTLAALAPTSAPNLALRGRFTWELLDSLGLGDRAVVTGCPSNFLNHAEHFYSVLKARVEKGRIDRLCVAAGNPYFANVRKLEATLARLVEATGGLYVAQAHIDMVRFARGENARNTEAERKAIHDFIAPERSPEELEIWRQRHAVSFADATSWMDAMRSCDFAVGARFHGVMLAVQAGVPGGVIAHDGRTLEMCRTMAIPARQAHEMTPDFDLAGLASLFAFDVEAFAKTRENLRAAYVGLLRGCGLNPPERLTKAQS